jgi:uncharacterized membrane protein YgcG
MSHLTPFNYFLVQRNHLIYIKKIYRATDRAARLACDRCRPNPLLHSSSLRVHPDGKSDLGWGRRGGGGQRGSGGDGEEGGGGAGAVGGGAW